MTRIEGGHYYDGFSVYLVQQAACENERMLQAVDRGEITLEQYWGAATLEEARRLRQQAAA